MCVACESCGQRTVWWSSLQSLEGTGTGMLVSGCCSKFLYLLSHLASQLSFSLAISLHMCVQMCGHLPRSYSLLYMEQGFSLNMELTVLSSLASSLLWRSIPAFVSWPLKVDHCALAFYMGSGSLNFSLHLAWQCFSHWVISQHHLKNSVDTERRATDKRWCLAEWSTKDRCRGKKKSLQDNDLWWLH